MAAQRPLGQLVGAGVLAERTGKRRNGVHANTGILATLEEYAATMHRG